MAWISSIRRGQVHIIVKGRDKFTLPSFLVVSFPRLVLGAPLTQDEVFYFSSIICPHTSRANSFLGSVQDAIGIASSGCSRFETEQECPIELQTYVVDASRRAIRCAAHLLLVKDQGISIDFG